MDKILCYYGCGQEAKFGNLRQGSGYSQPGDMPRCSKQMSDCPVVRQKALRAAKINGRLGRRWINRF